MDRISDSGSDGCGSIPHGGTFEKSSIECVLLTIFCLSGLDTCVILSSCPCILSISI